MLRLAFVVVSLVVFGSCKEDNSLYCQNGAHSDDPDCVEMPMPDASPDAGPDAGPEKCETSTDCMSTAEPVCDPNLDGGTCVQCTAANTMACTGTTPVCTNDICVACTKHSDCTESSTCLPSGACAASVDVAYVDGDNGAESAACSKTAPCISVQKAAASKSIIKVVGTVKSRTDINNRSVTILAEDGAQLAPPDNDSTSALDVRGNSVVEIYDLRITKPMNANANGVVVSDSAVLKLTRVVVGPNGANGIGLMGNAELICTRCEIAGNAARGIDAVAGKITVSRSTVKNNTGGGVRVMGSTAFHIIGNVIWNNGQGNKINSGGIFIAIDEQSPGDEPNELNFNSISRNVTSDGIPSSKGHGIDCSVGTDLVASSNIVWANGTVGSVQVSNTKCTHVSSNIGPTVFPGTNRNEDPLFVDEPMGNLHLKKESGMIGVVPLDTSLGGAAALDIDGDTRVGPADIGADYVLPRPLPPAVR